MRGAHPGWRSLTWRLGPRRRCARLSLYGLLLDGPVGHLWYQVLDRHVYPENPTSTRAVLIKTALDQLVWGPLMTLVFFGEPRGWWGGEGAAAGDHLCPWSWPRSLILVGQRGCRDELLPMRRCVAGSLLASQPAKVPEGYAASTRQGPLLVSRPAYAADWTTQAQPRPATMLRALATRFVTLIAQHLPA